MRLNAINIFSFKLAFTGFRSIETPEYVSRSRITLFSFGTLKFNILLWFWRLNSKMLYGIMFRTFDLFSTVSMSVKNYSKKNWQNRYLNSNKRPTSLNGHLSIRDITLTSCQRRGHIAYQQPNHRRNRNQQWQRKAAL